MLEDADVLGSFVSSSDRLGAAAAGSLKRPGLVELVVGSEGTDDVALDCGGTESW